MQRVTRGHIARCRLMVKLTPLDEELRIMLQYNMRIGTSFKQYWAALNRYFDALRVLRNGNKKTRSTFTKRFDTRVDRFDRRWEWIDLIYQKRVINKLLLIERSLWVIQIHNIYSILIDWSLQTSIQCQCACAINNKQ